MERKSRIHLDNPAMRGRLRDTRTTPVYDRPYAQQAAVAGFQVPPQPRSQSPQTIATAGTPATDIKPPTPNTSAKKRPDLPKQLRSNVLTRQSVQKQSQKYRPKKYRRPLLPMVLTAMAIMVFTAGLLVVVNSLKTNHTVKAQTQQVAKKTDQNGMTDGVPSEDEPVDSLNSYVVSPDMPRFFIIDKLSVKARINRVGVGTSNEINAPNNIFDVGWYDASAKPGEGGTAVLDGHISGPTKHGAFYSIGTLKSGDKVKVERGDGKILTYTVTGTQVYDAGKIDMPKIMTTSVAGKPALNFMTSSGRFNIRTNQYEQRVVVFTTQD